MPTSADNLRRVCEERTRQARVDPRTTSSLVSAALAADEDTCFDCVCLLHYRATREVLEAARGLGKSECSDERALGAWILGQLGIPDRVFPDECLATLLEMLNVEQDIEVLQSICTALGHLHDP